ncbi:YraN family protein [Luteimonas sp. SDU101]|uniref:YraN family protein n=1 Tax=unclassified Luteimonas TaxID=2629088 RepID=UPI003EBCF425
MTPSRQPPPTSTRGRGAAIEAAAARHLAAAGLRPVAANASARVGELDLVMLDGETLVFIEVRYRRSNRFGGGAASVDAGKRRRLVLAARQFLASHPRHREAACRFDVVEASGDPDAPALTWIRDAFRADDA